MGSKGGKIGSIGKTVEGWEIKILNEDEKDLAPGTNNIGEIAMKSAFPLSLEYYKPPINTPMTLGKEGYILTGDLGYKDNDGYIYYVGRKDEIIKKGGKYILPYFIENVANAHPNVLESAVFEVSSEESQEVEIKICIVLKRSKQLKYEEFHDYMKENLAYYMVPRFIEFKQKLRSSSERIKKYLLKEEWDMEDIKKCTWDAKIGDFHLNLN